MTSAIVPSNTVAQSAALRRAAWLLSLAANRLRKPGARPLPQQWIPRVSPALLHTNKGTRIDTYA